MALAWWTNVMTGERLDERELAGARMRARRVYEANTHIFEDELDTLSALGVVPLLEFGTGDPWCADGGPMRA